MGPEYQVAQAFLKTKASKQTNKTHSVASNSVNANRIQV